MFGLDKGRESAHNEPMSITINPELARPDYFAIQCGCGEHTFVTTATYDEAVALYRKEDTVPCCDAYGDTPSIVAMWDNEGPWVNVSNNNAVGIFERLGVEFDYCGSMSAADMLGKAMVANVGGDDSGTDTVQDGNMIHCGLRAGYYEQKMDEIAAVAQWAIDNDVDNVTWG